MTLHLETFAVGPMDNRLYIVRDDEAREFVVIDPSLNSDPALERAHALVDAGYRFNAIWLTHGHFDHVYDNARWKREFGVPIYGHPADGFFLEHLREQAIWFGMEQPEVVPADEELTPETKLKIGSHPVPLLHLPGHSPGSMAFHFPEEEWLISGDVLFAGSVGRTDLPGSDAGALARSVSQLFALPPATRVFPGHGSDTTVAAEQQSNAVARELLSRSS
jgi:glyoxylase-like metal-dependent hydrolase (beta-lactamase superfamily II)